MTDGNLTSHIRTLQEAGYVFSRKGYVGSRLGSPTPERGGRRKRFYHLLPSGRAALAASLAAIRRMSHGLSGLLTDEPR